MPDATKPNVVVIWGDDDDWFPDRAYLTLAATFVTGEFLATFKDFPPRQKAPSFTIDQAMEKLEAGIASN